MSAGHVRQRGTNRWELRWRASGRLHTATVTARSQRDAQKQLAVKIADAERGIVADAPAKLTVGAYIDQWLIRLDVKPLTLQGYTSVARSYLKPDLGRIRLRDLNASAIRAAFMKWHAAGAAKSSLRQVKVVLQSCLRSALIDDLIAVNPMDKLRSRKGQPDLLPVAMSPKAIPVAADKITELLANDQGSHYHICIVLAVAAGLRRGEILGLRWRNVDLDSGKITIAEQLVPLKGGALFVPPKSASGRRTIKLPVEAIDALREHWRITATRLLAAGIRLTGDHTVACDALGRPLYPQTFGKCAARRGFKPHNLRHAHLSKLANSGIPIAAVSKRAGHADIRTTLASYVHADASDEDTAAEVIAGLLR